MIESTSDIPVVCEEFPRLEEHISGAIGMRCNPELIVVLFVGTSTTFKVGSTLYKRDALFEDWYKCKAGTKITLTQK